MSKDIAVLLTALPALLTVGYGEAATSTPTSILSGPLAKIDIKDAEIEAIRGTAKGRLIIAQHYALDPAWLDPLEHQAAATQPVYDYLVLDAMIKPMPQGLNTSSLAERAEMTADFTKAAFPLRQGLKVHDGQPLTTKDVRLESVPSAGGRRHLFVSPKSRNYGLSIRAASISTNGTS